MNDINDHILKGYEINYIHLGEVVIKRRELQNLIDCIREQNEKLKKYRSALELLAHDKPVHDGFTSMTATEIAKVALKGK